MKQTWICAVVLVLFALSGTGQAAGRTELNQAVIEEAGGFPYTISASRNFVLTGSLVVPSGTDGLLLTSTEIVLDLNGFSISSSAVCVPGNCSSGLGSAIRPLSGIAHGHRSSVQNGTVRGFAGDCILLGASSRVSDMLVTECGQRGISVGGGSVLTQNRVVSTGSEGIRMGDTPAPAIFAHNTVISGGLVTAGPDVIGGRASASNACEDGSCGVGPTRRFYLTLNGDFDGSEASTACDPGFHMASMWEVIDPSNLRYDTTRGVLGMDSGSGPPNLTGGWIRTGVNSDVFGGAGGTSCLGYTTTTGSGTAANFSRAWDASPAPDPDLPGWSAFEFDCDQNYRVWCVED